MSLAAWVGRSGIRPRARASREGPSERNAGSGSEEEGATKPPGEDDGATKPPDEEDAPTKREAGRAQAAAAKPLLCVGDNAVDAGTTAGGCAVLWADARLGPLVFRRLAGGGAWTVGAPSLTQASKSGVNENPAPGKLRRNHGSTGTAEAPAAAARELEECVVVGMALDADMPHSGCHLLSQSRRVV